MVRAYSERLEIAFWGFIIPLMRGESPISRLVQAFLPAALAVAQRRKFLLRMAKMAAWAWAGLILGLILGFLRAGMG